jgi:hypothetical protein
VSESTDQGFSGKRTAQVVGITYRQLDYWARTDLGASRPMPGSGHDAGTRTAICSSEIIKNLLMQAFASVRSPRIHRVRVNVGLELASRIS